MKMGSHQRTIELAIFKFANCKRLPGRVNPEADSVGWNGFLGAWLAIFGRSDAPSYGVMARFVSLSRWGRAANPPCTWGRFASRQDSRSRVALATQHKTSTLVFNGVPVQSLAKFAKIWMVEICGWVEELHSSSKDPDKPSGPLKSNGDHQTTVPILE